MQNWIVTKVVKRYRNRRVIIVPGNRWNDRDQLRHGGIHWTCDSESDRGQHRTSSRSVRVHQEVERQKFLQAVAVSWTQLRVHHAWRQEWFECRSLRWQEDCRNPQLRIWSGKTGLGPLNCTGRVSIVLDLFYVCFTLSLFIGFFNVLRTFGFRFYNILCHFNNHL